MAKHSCPTHGSKYIVKEGSSYYCAFPTPGERFSKCFFHPTGKPHSDIYEEDKGKEKPDVMKALFTNDNNYRIRNSKNAQHMRELRASRREGA